MIIARILQISFVLIQELLKYVYDYTFHCAFVPLE